MVVLLVVRSRSKKSSDEIPAVEMPLLTPMTMTPDPDPVFPLPTDETDPSSTVVLKVCVSMLRVYGCSGGCTDVCIWICMDVLVCTLTV